MDAVAFAQGQSFNSKDPEERTQKENSQRLMDCILYLGDRRHHSSNSRVRVDQESGSYLVGKEAAVQGNSDVLQRCVMEQLGRETQSGHSGTGGPAKALWQTRRCEGTRGWQKAVSVWVRWKRKNESKRHFQTMDLMSDGDTE
ncbi:hypothetical protein P7K49_007398 [Saguinus oedipus]|uniref:Uncharacterized protein n=1 Tax=Saguinus oedipus TaxID=9490 RepID=A0ABQ9VUS5_SAGOE|nr:hypothetical protein P7K49_007398 [Saguinus oedipus]